MIVGKQARSCRQTTSACLRSALMFAIMLCLRARLSGEFAYCESELTLKVTMRGKGMRPSDEAPVLLEERLLRGRKRG